jgi:hypothetical protein
VKALRRAPWWLWLLAVAFVAAAFGVAEARPGGGHSYSGGSSSSGGGGGDGAGALVYLLIRLIIVWPEVGIPIAIVVVIGVVVAKRNNDGLGDWDSGESIASHVRQPRLDDVRRIDPEFSEVLFSDFAYALYARAHQARVHPNAMASCAPYLSAGVRASLMQRAPQGQPVHGVIIGAMRPVVVHIPHQSTDDEGNPNHVQITLHFESNMTVGPPDAWHTYYVHERWTFNRLATTHSRGPAKARSLDCPNCDAAFESPDDATCAYCGEIVNDGRFDWVVNSLMLMHQEQRPPMLTGHAQERGTQLATVWHGEVEQALAGLQASDPAVTVDGIGARLALVYHELNAAWGALDLARARPYVSDGIYNYLGYWITAYRQQGLVNKLDNAKITRWVIAKVIVDKHYAAVTVRVWGTGNDYTMEQASGKLVGGSRGKLREYTEYWTLIRGAEVKGAPRSDKQCPNCAAELNISMAGTCEYCNAHITSGEFDWVLSKIEQDEAYTG